jgi:hypothetical protein
MSLDSLHCALCLRRDVRLLDAGPVVSSLCLNCAGRVGRFILERAGHAVVWDLDRTSPGVGRRMTRIGKLLADEMQDLTRDFLTQPAPGTVSLSVFDGPPNQEPPKELLKVATVHLDIDVRAALKTAATVLALREVTDEVRVRALRVVFNVRILRPGALHLLRSVMFKE